MKYKLDKETVLYCPMNGTECGGNCAWFLPPQDAKGSQPEGCAVVILAMHIAELNMDGIVVCE